MYSWPAFIRPIEIRESITFVSITSVRYRFVRWVRFVYDPLKENVIITFRSYIIIMSESYVRLTLRSYVTKSCK